MTTNSHLAHLLAERRALLRELARLDVAISMERAPMQGRSLSAAGPDQQAPSSWEEALHRAKIPLLYDSFLPG